MYREEDILQKAIREASRWDGYVDNNEYYVLMKYAAISGSLGAAARDALATAKKWEFRPFRGVIHRDRNNEEFYAKMGVPRYY